MASITLGQFINAIRVNITDDGPEDNQKIDDGTLIHYINESLAWISREVDWFVERKLVRLGNDTVIVDFSDQAVRLLRVEYMNEKLEQTSTTEMDYENPTWPQDTGNRPKAIIVDKNRDAHFQVYPRLTGITPSTPLKSNQVFGRLIAVNRNRDTSAPLEVIDETPGRFDVDLGLYIRVTYVKRFEVMNAVTTQAETDAGQTYKNRDINMEYDYMLMLAHYSAYRFFDSYDRAIDKDRAKQQFSLYAQKLESFKKAKSSNSANKSVHVPYNPYSRSDTSTTSRRYGYGRYRRGY